MEDVVNLETIGAGGITGFITTIIALLFWNQRISKLEESKTNKDECNKVHNAIMTQFNTFQQDLSYIRNRLDKLIDRELNGISK